MALVPAASNLLPTRLAMSTHRSGFWAFLPVTTLVLVAALGGNAAATKERAREAWKRATTHYNLGEYDQAFEAFKEAYREYEDPSFLYNLAQCHRQLGHKTEAVRFYKTYLSQVPDASNRASVEQAIATLENA